VIQGIGGNPLSAGHQTAFTIVVHFNIDRVTMKRLNPAEERNMAKEIIFLVEETPEGGYTARALGHSICTEADSLVALKKRVQAATRCHFAAKEMPRVIRLHIVKDEVIPV